MSNVTAITDRKTDLAELVAEDKKQRGEQCLAEVNASLKANNCMVNVFVIIGEMKVPLSAVISLPVEISIDAAA